MRIEPPVSEPSAAQAAPVATDTAPPLVDPPGTRGCASRTRVAGFAGVPWCAFSPTPEKANSLRFVWPTSAAPARRSRATAGQSAVAGAASASDCEPAVVGAPATSKRSFTDTARPPNNGSGCAASRSSPTLRAVALAPVSKRRTKACRQSSDCAAAVARSRSARGSRVPVWTCCSAAQRSVGAMRDKLIGFVRDSTELLNLIRSERRQEVQRTCKPGWFGAGGAAGSITGWCRGGRTNREPGCPEVLPRRSGS